MSNNKVRKLCFIHSLDSCVPSETDGYQDQITTWKHIFDMSKWKNDTKIHNKAKTIQIKKNKITHQNDNIDCGLRMWSY